MDSAAVTFTDTFYKLIFQENVEICRAFQLAQNNVGIRHGPEEEKKFLLLIYDEKHECINRKFSIGLKPKLEWTEMTKYSDHYCNALLNRKFKDGKPMDTHVSKTTLIQKSRKVDLIGREKLIYELLNKLMSPFSKIYTVWGQHGVGKSAIVSAVMHYINERTLIKGGFVVVNANGISNIEVFARKLTIELVEDND
jgi:ATP-dependent Clp protease ATP-binding subunit ClpA